MEIQMAEYLNNVIISQNFEINIRKCDKNDACEHFDEKLSVALSVT